MDGVPFVGFQGFDKPCRSLKVLRQIFKGAGLLEDNLVSHLVVHQVKDGLLVFFHNPVSFVLAVTDGEFFVYDGVCNGSVIIAGGRHEAEIETRYLQVVFSVFVTIGNQHVQILGFQTGGKQVQIEPSVQYGSGNKAQENLYPLNIVSRLVPAVSAVPVRINDTGVDGRYAFTNQFGVPKRRLEQVQVLDPGIFPFQQVFQHRG